MEWFYLLLWEQIEKFNFDATTIYNMDETGVRSTTSKPPKILSTKGKKQVGVISSAERGQLTTVICCCNAAGAYLPPFFIFARKRMQDRLLDGAPPSSRASVSDNGRINGQVFLLWLQYFVEMVRPNENRKVLLLLDNHESHKYYPALEFARKNHVIFVSFAPHTTNKMQPLDVAVYGPIKKYFEQEINTFQKSHPGRIINQYDIAKLFGGAYSKGASVQNAIQGFKKPGLWPYNPHVFGDEDYAPSSITDRPLEENASENISPLHDSISLPRDNITPLRDILPPSHDNTALQCSIVKTENHDTTIKSLSPFQVRPIPIVAAPKTARKNKRQRAEVLTSSPIRIQQASKFQKVDNKKVKIVEIAGPTCRRPEKKRHKKQRKYPIFLFGVF